MGNSRGIYLSAEGLRESRCCTRGYRERGEMKDVMPVVVNEEKKKPLKIGICHSMLNSLWTQNMYLKNEMPRKSKSFYLDFVIL